MATRIPRQWVVPALFAVAAGSTAMGTTGAVSHALSHPGARPGLEAAYDVLRTVVAGGFAFLTVGRAPARRRGRHPFALVACAVAMGLFIVFRTPPPSAPVAVEILGESISLVACVLLAVSLFTLGRCFSVLPDARGLVTSGPYALVRHPVYACEIGAFVGLAVAAPVVGNAFLLVMLFAAQCLRMRFEERTLTQAFPEYADYARTVPALVPLPRAVVDAARSRTVARSGRVSKEMTMTQEART